MALLLVQFGAQAAEVLGLLGVGVAFAGFAFADAFIVVEAFAVLLLEALNVLVLRHPGRLVRVGVLKRGSGGEENLSLCPVVRRVYGGHEFMVDNCKRRDLSADESRSVGAKISEANAAKDRDAG